MMFDVLGRKNALVMTFLSIPTIAVTDSGAADV
jgi:hypothetical protein